MRLFVRLGLDQHQNWWCTVLSCQSCMLSISILFTVFALSSSIGITDARNTQVMLPENNNLNLNHSLLLKRSLLSTAEYGEDPGDGSCSNEDIVIMQGASAPLPSGIPTYTVEIMNACVSGCSICNIHVRCGWFSSARLIDPNIFRRLCYDDCLVNDGDPLAAGETLSFQYADTYQYPLSVSSVICC